MSETPREKPQWELDFESILDRFGIYVQGFMQLLMAVMVLAILYRFYDIYCDFVDPVKKKEREEARREKETKKDE